MPSTLHCANDIIYEISSVRRTTLIHLCSQVAKVGTISTTIFSIGEYFLNVFTEDQGQGRCWGFWATKLNQVCDRLMTWHLYTITLELLFQNVKSISL